jgi:hypothetical protein
MNERIHFSILKKKRRKEEKTKKQMPHHDINIKIGKLKNT